MNRARLIRFTVVVIIAIMVTLVSLALAQNFCGGLLILSSATPTPTPSSTPGVFPQFSTTGAIVQSYSSTSIFPMNMFSLDDGNGVSTTDAINGGINAWETNFFYPFPADAAAWGCGVNSDGTQNGTSFSLSCYESAWVANRWNPKVSTFQSSGIPYVSTNDNAEEPGSGLNTSYAGINAYPYMYGVVPYISQYLEAHAPALGMIVSQISHDEWGVCEAACNPNIGEGNMFDGYGLGFTGYGSVQQTESCGNVGACPSWTPTAPITTAPFAHIAYGIEQGSFLSYVSYVIQNPTMSDYEAFEGTGGSCGGFEGGSLCSVTPSKLSWLEYSDYFRTNVIVPSRGQIANFLGTEARGPYYWSNHTTSPHAFIPGTDVLNDSGSTPANIAAGIWFAVAHSYQGVRNYNYDTQGQANQRTGAVPNSALCTDYNSCSQQNYTFWQLGASPNATYASYGGLGQDRWYAQSIAYRLIASLKPYVLQPAMASPSAQNVCDDGTATTSSGTGNGSSPGDPIVCGAKSGNNGHLVVLINFSDSSHNYTFNPAPYVLGGTAQSWKIIGGNSASCGAQLSTYAGLISGGAPYDCDIGETTLNGADWLPGNSEPAAGTAPTTTTTLSMQPLEVDVFLYHS